MIVQYRELSVRHRFTVKKTTKGIIMLVLSRKIGETIRIGGIEITVVRIKGKFVRLGIKAPSGVTILRGELNDRHGNRLDRQTTSGQGNAVDTYV